MSIGLFLIQEILIIVTAARSGSVPEEHNLIWRDDKFFPGRHFMFTKHHKFISIRVFLALVLGMGVFKTIPVNALEDYSPALAGISWYVSTTGNDLNSCSSTGSPCATIGGAMDKASIGDVIKVASGMYTGPVDVNKSIQISGGWNSTFSTQNGAAIIDGQYATIALAVISMPESPIVVDLSRLIIQHGNSTGLYVSNATLTLTNSTIRDNQSVAYAGGMYASVNNTITLNNVTITGNYAGWNGGGIYSYGETNTITIKNSTIANNFAGLDGGGAVLNGVITIQNSILADNTAAHGADCSGTIDTSQSNIIEDSTGCTITTGTGNQIDTDPLIGASPSGSLGYHALKPGSPAINAGNPATCLATDVRGVARPQGGTCDMGAYEYVSPGSANAFGISSGTPQETAPRTSFPSQFAVYVTDATGNPVSGATVTFTAPSSGASGTFSSSGTRTASLLTDQAGLAIASSFTANSQQGTYNVNAAVTGLVGSVSFVLANAAWYVASTGSDINPCNVSASPCATINKAIEKASDGDTILVAAGTYTSANINSPVVSVEKDLVISGGWNSAFTVQNDYSTIDGENTKIGVGVGPSTLPGYLFNPTLDHFVIQNGHGFGVGALNVQDSDLEIKNMLIINNVGEFDGGGVKLFDANLTITDSIIGGNTTLSEYGNGG